MPLAGVVVTVVDENNPNNTATVTTNEQGQFNFVKMFPGTYRLIQTQPINLSTVVSAPERSAARQVRM